MKSLIAAAMRLAVVKSGLRSASRTWLSRLSAKSISRSMIAPLEMRPTVGTPRMILAASPSAWKPPIATEPCADRVDVAVGAEQRRDQQRAALQALGVAERRDRDVDARALGAEGRQVGGHHHGGDVAGADGLAADVDAEPLQHRLQRLPGERDVVERVAGAVEADDQAVADELVLAHALDVGEVLDARRRRHAIGPSAREGAAAQPDKISAATAAANARCNVRITLLPNEFGPHDRYAERRATRVAESSH